MLRTSRHEAASDALTGLSNRRSLIAELERRLAADEPEPAVLALFDLDGFKAYNDALRPPGRRRAAAAASARALGATVGGRGAAYRMGGDEFCVLLARRRQRATSSAAPQRALSESGEGFAVGASHGRGRRCPARRARVADALRSPTSACTRTSAAARTSAEQPDRRDVLLRVAARARARPRRPRRRGRRARRAAPRAGSGSRSTASRAVRQRRRAARHRQARDPRRDPQQARPARRRRVGVHAPAHADRRAHPRRGAGAARRRPSSCARATSAGTATATPTGSPASEIPLGARIDRGLRRLRRDGHRPPLPRARCRARRRSRELRALRRHAVRPGRGRGVPRGARHRRGVTCRRWPDPEILARVDSSPAPVKRDPLEALRAAFGTGDLRRLQFGWAATSVGSWASWSCWPSTPTTSAGRRRSASPRWCGCSPPPSPRRSRACWPTAARAAT